MSKTEVFERIGFGDLVISKDETDKLTSKWISITGSDGEKLGEIEAYHVGYELEDGEECNEDGSEI